MKLIPLIGSLLISAAPVQGFETFEELNKACEASEEINNICAKASRFASTASWVTLLCELEAEGSLTKEDLFLNWDKFIEKNDYWSPLSEDAVEMALKSFPDCSIKPIR
ncbi:hypothetical protein [Synechococcus sp. MIT S1220]|uniref:hypothetical protein n=1 Tax=Synechococcus sp. MIT S1220 TaxID=3082549 RepID=UPI0039AF1281